MTKTLILFAATAASTLALAGAASAQERPGVRLENAAARLIVIPEARGDVSVSIKGGDSRLPPLRTRMEGRTVVVDGDLRNRIESCGSVNINVGVLFHPDARPYPGQRVMIRGVGPLALDRLPVVTARVPMDAAVAAGGAVWGEVGPTEALHLSKDGCGDFRLADVHGVLDLASHGSGDTFAHHAGRLHASVAGSGNLTTEDVGGSADLVVSGSGDVKMGRVAGGVSAQVNGSGNMTAEETNGPINVAISGSGDLTVHHGHAPAVAAQVAGSGDFRFDGDAGSLTAQVAGSGDVHVAHVSGAVTKVVSGSGEVTVGR